MKAPATSKLESRYPITSQRPPYQPVRTIDFHTSQDGSLSRLLRGSPKYVTCAHPSRAFPSIANPSQPIGPEATREEMRDAKLPLAYRDSCANLLIPLNRCRFETYYLPWKCEVRPPLLSSAHEQEIMLMMAPV